MAAPARPDLDATEEPVGDWTEERFLDIPASRRRIELLDGGLLVSPSAGSPHQRLSFRLCYVFERARPDDMEALEAVNVRVGPGKILIPDVVVVRAANPGPTVWDAPDVILVVELLGPNRGPVDHEVKPGLYAAAGIPHYLRVTLGPDGPDATLYRLDGGRYREITRARPGEELRLTEPVAVSVDLAALLDARRLPD